jgi:hypothetical protein
MANHGKAPDEINWSGPERQMRQVGKPLMHASPKGGIRGRHWFRNRSKARDMLATRLAANAAGFLRLTCSREGDRWKRGKM